ncbi:immunoglobulin domain-containing family protein [Methanoregula formicica]|uniref:Uncharacterized protein n=1 Tax=Methanoregula formicica (strain DSM 22288 / NBRC 105244 / SMSP) TaxID=593750 RepID=L0HJ98_METFS|nr:hypothetical protein [Methanoregula formicica]AGB03383.1 hypothetical protein Metfor_2381 [Methanoregula formicica SMSP]
MTVEEKFGIVVMLDALGVSNFTIEECKQFIQNFDENISDLQKINKSIFSMVETHKNKEKARVVSNSLKNVGFSQFGDTLVMAWPIDRKEDIHNSSLMLSIVMMLSSLIGNSLDRKIPLRGCISVGEYVWAENNRTILGPAIFDASSWYNSADWFGIIFSPKTHFWLGALSEGMKKSIDDALLIPMWKVHIFEYPVPLTRHAGSNSTNQIFSVVGWPYFFYYHQDKNTSPRKKLCQFLFSMPMPKGTESKYKNSADFFNWYETEIYQKNPRRIGEINHPILHEDNSTKRKSSRKD